MITSGSIDQALERPELLVVTGKGGVGKTTVTVVLGSLLAARGRRVLVIEADPRESAHQMLGVAPTGGEVTEVGDRLLLQNLRARQVLDQLVREQLRIPAVVRRVLESQVYRHFAEGAPGLEELAILGHALRMLRGISAPQVDVVVLDAPASGHGASLLEAPRRVSETIRTGPFGRMAGQLSRFVGHPESCGVVVTTQAEELPVQETVELLAGLGAGGGPRPALVAINSLFPNFPAGSEGSGDPLTKLWRQRRGVNERERDRLRRVWKGPLLELPMLAIERGPKLLEALLGEVERQASEQATTEVAPWS